MRDVDPFATSLLIYGATAALAALYVVAAVGVLCVFGEALVRAARWHRKALARARGRS